MKLRRRRIKVQTASEFFADALPERHPSRAKARAMRFVACSIDLHDVDFLSAPAGDVVLIDAGIGRNRLSEIARRNLASRLFSYAVEVLLMGKPKYFSRDSRSVVCSYSPSSLAS